MNTGHLNFLIILNLLPRIDEAKYTALEHAFGALSRDMNREFSGELIRTLNQADPVYFQEITSIVNSLMEGLRDRRNLDFKYNLISAITRLNPDLYPFIQNFLTDNPALLR